MGIMQIFQSGNRSITDIVKEGISVAKDSGVSPERVLEELEKLRPGEVLTGKILDKGENEVRLLVNILGKEAEVNARLSQSQALSVGQNLSFQINKGGNQILLNPLFTNMGMEENGKKALSMAGIAENDRSLLLVSTLMKEGMSIDKNSLSDFYRDAMEFRDASIMDIIDLNRLGLPVNDQNLEQMSAYKNMTHQLTDGVIQIAQELPGTLEEMCNGGQVSKVYDFIQSVFVDLGEEFFMENETVSGGKEEVFPENKNVLTEMGEAASGDNKTMGPVTGAEDMKNKGALSMPGEEEALGKQNTVRTGEPVLLQESENGQESILPGKENLQLHVKVEEKSLEWKNLFLGIKEGTLSREEAEVLLKQLCKAPEGKEALKEWYLKGSLMEPEQIQEESVKRLFKSIKNQLNKLTDLLNNSGMQETGLARMVQTTSHNLEFLDQMNQMYAYIQLPFRMTMGESNGELYVYTNKKNLSSAEGEISAFLHLDMPHLGAVDCMVKMKEQNVSTRFTLENEESLMFINEHMETLTKRLQNRGYDIHVKASLAEKETQEESQNKVFKELIQRQSNKPLASQLSFDVRT